MFSKNNSNNSTSNVSTPEASRKPTARTNAGGPSILGRDIVITGEIKTEGDVQIDGRLEGNIHAGRLTIGEQGAVNGNVEAKAVYVRGKMSGKVEASLVELAETANVTADIIQDQLTIANGAFFDGKCSRRKKKPVGTVTPAKAKASDAKKSA